MLIHVITYLGSICDLEFPFNTFFTHLHFIYEYEDILKHFFKIIICSFFEASDKLAEKLNTIDEISH